MLMIGCWNSANDQYKGTCKPRSRLATIFVIYSLQVLETKIGNNG